MRLFRGFRPVDPAWKWRVAQDTVRRQHTFNDKWVCVCHGKTYEQLVQDATPKGENDE